MTNQSTISQVHQIAQEYELARQKLETVYQQKLQAVIGNTAPTVVQAPTTQSATSIRRRGPRITREGKLDELVKAALFVKSVGQTTGLSLSSHINNGRAPYLFMSKLFPLIQFNGIRGASARYTAKDCLHRMTQAEVEQWVKANCLH